MPEAADFGILTQWRMLQEIAKDEEEIRELRARVKELEGQLKGCKGGAQKAGRKEKGRRIAWSYR